MLFIMGLKIGYARVSTIGQNLESQIKLLEEYGCAGTHIYTDKKTGADIERPGLKCAIQFIREGDIFVVTKLDRLGRSLKDILLIHSKLKEKKASLVILDCNIDTSKSSGEFMIGILGSVAEFETNIRRERQAEGISIAKSKGIYKGRSSLGVGIINEIKSLRLNKISIREIAKRVNVAPSSVLKYIKE